MIEAISVTYRTKNQAVISMKTNDINAIIASFISMEEALDHFEIGFDSTFINENRTQLMKLFAGNLILEKPNDWFSARKALKKAYCKVQRSRLNKTTRQACRGCTTCQRR